MKNTEIKTMVGRVATQLALQGLILSHEYAQTNKSKLDIGLLREAAQNLSQMAQVLKIAAKAVESKAKA
jgi:hypothetical protein